MAGKFTEQELNAIKDTFKSFDRNADGRISMEELEAAMRQCGQTPTKLEVKLLMNQVDKDKNGVITIDEFIEYMANPPHHRYNTSDLKARFEIFDKDGDGYITRDEMVSIVQELELGKEFPQAVIDQIFTDADTNKDGKISYDEFEASMS